VVPAKIGAHLDAIPDRRFSGGVGVDAIEAAERAFRGRFPADFVDFLLTLGSGYAGSEEFMGLGGEEHLDIVSVAKDLRAPSTHSAWPDHYVPLRNDGFGNHDCIDLSASRESDSRVVLWTHSAPGAPHHEVLADGYWVWFEGVLEMARELPHRRSD